MCWFGWEFPACKVTEPYWLLSAPYILLGSDTVVEEGPASGAAMF